MPGPPRPTSSAEPPTLKSEESVSWWAWSVPLDGDGPGRAVDRDAVAGGDRLRGTRDADHGGDAVLPGHDRAMGVRTAHLHHQSTGREEQRRPPGVGRGRHQELARLEARADGVEDDPR